MVHNGKDLAKYLKGKKISVDIICYINDRLVSIRDSLKEKMVMAYEEIYIENGGSIAEKGKAALIQIVMHSQVCFKMIFINAARLFGIPEEELDMTVQIDHKLLEGNKLCLAVTFPVWVTDLLQKAYVMFDNGKSKVDLDGENPGLGNGEDIAAKARELVINETPAEDKATLVMISNPVPVPGSANTIN